MFCTRCGTENAEQNRYCYECGQILAADQHAKNTDLIVKEPGDKLNVSDLIFEAMKLYDLENLDGAFDKCREILSIDPSSSSARSLLGLVYEKQADNQIAKGNTETAEDYLLAAIRQLSQIVDENPGSTADKLKLNSLHSKLDELKGKPARKPVLSVLDRIPGIKKIPLPIVAGVGTTLVVFIIFASVLGHGSKNARSKAKPSDSNRQVVAQPQNQVYPYGQQQAQAPMVAQGTYPQQGMPQQQPYAAQPQQTQQPQTTQAPPVTYPQQQPNYAQRPVEPPPVPQQSQALPPYPIQGIPKPSESTATPQSHEQKQPAQPITQKKPEEPKKTVAPERSPTESARAAYGAGDYQSAATFYEQAISRGTDSAEIRQNLGMCQYNMGKKSTAITNFQRAVQLYLDKKARGIDVDGSDAGIRTCKLYIDLSKE